MLNDAAPTFRFNRPRTVSALTLPQRRIQLVEAPDQPTAAQPAESGRTGAETGSCDGLAADAERFLHQVRRDGSQRLDSAGSWAGLLEKRTGSYRPNSVALAMLLDPLE